MIQNSHDDIINDIGKSPYVYKRKHNISNIPNKKEIINEDKKKSNKYKILLLLLLLLLIILVLFFGIFFGLRTKKDDNHGRNMNINLNNINTIGNNTDKIIENSIDYTINNYIDIYSHNIEYTFNNTNNKIFDNINDNKDNINNNNIDNSMEKIDNIIGNDTILEIIGNTIKNNIENSFENIDNTIDGITIDNNNYIDNNHIDNNNIVDNTDNTNNYSIKSSIVNVFDNNEDTKVFDYISEPECINKKYSFKGIYHANTDNETVKLMNYIPNKIIDMIVDGIDVNEEQKQNDSYTFHSKGKHTVYILINITKCTSLQGFFTGIINMISISFTPEFNTENVENMNEIFASCPSLISIKFSNLTTQKVKTMEAMFCGCNSLHFMDFSNLDLRNVEIMDKFCYRCVSLASVNFTNTTTLNLTSYPGLFANCINLTSIELSNFKTRNIDFIFDYCSNLRYIDIRAINCQPEYASLGCGFSSYGTIIINSNCSNLIQNYFSNWTVIII